METVDFIKCFNTSFVNNITKQNYILKLNNNPNLKFFKDELTIKYIGKGYSHVDYASVQADKPIITNVPVFYFEVEIIDEGSKKDVTIGFSDKDFILNKQCGSVSKSFGYNGSDGKIYKEKSKGESFGPKFKAKDIIGCGFHFAKHSIFYTLNGRFLGYAFDKIEHSKYFPTVSLHSLNEKVSVNFGAKTFVFNVEGFYIEELHKRIIEINNKDISKFDMDYAIKEYLVHSGYQETFNELEKENENEYFNLRNNDDKHKHTNNNNHNAFYHRDSVENQLRAMMSSNDNLENVIETGINKDNNMFPTIDLRFRKYSDEVSQLMKAPEIRERSLSLLIDRMNSANPAIKGSNKNNQSAENEEDVFKIISFLEERKVIHNIIVDHHFKTALDFFVSHFKGYSDSHDLLYKKILLALVVLVYLDNLAESKYYEAYEFLNNLDPSLWDNELKISLYNKSDKPEEFSLQDLSILLCYENIKENIEFLHLFKEKQIHFVSNQINSMILQIAGLSSESVLEKIIKQFMLTEHVYNIIHNCPGETFNINLN